ncbi:hypothetical protein A2159_02680, partial [Candidatus Woesebacteria bacterium RBG_13_34_9]
RDAEQGRSIKIQTSNLSVNDIYEKLLAIAQDSGEGSQERKVYQMAKILYKLDPLSSKFVARIPVGRLRLGFSDKTVLDALSWMETGGKEAKKDLEEAYNVLPDVGLLAKQVKEHGIKRAVINISPIVGVPVLPVLAQRLKSPREIIEKMKRVALESKFDGLRIQIHYKNNGFGKNEGNVKAYTRNLNEVSWMFPELKGIEKNIKANEAIFDTEAVGVDEKRKTLANFQTTMTRRRKHDIEKIASNVSIKFYVFDILTKNKVNLIPETYLKRRKELNSTVINGNLIEKVEYKISTQASEIEAEMKKKLREGFEGIMIKKVDSEYIAGRRGWRWVKMKEEEGTRTKLADTLDCIVMGYYTGKGKRVGFGLGGFLVGIYVGEQIKTLTKIGTGLSDDQFKELHKRLVRLGVFDKPKEYGEVSKTLIPDFWVKPELVVEIAADEITKSPIHSSSYALRFPRLVRFRDDKNIKEATTLREVKELFNLQKNIN